MSEPEPEAPDPLEGLTNPVCAGVERIAIRLRESAVTLSGWRLAVTADRDEGAIVLVETPAGSSLYRGDGVFLGWPQARLEAAYRRLLPQSDDPSCDVVQGG